MSRCDLHVMDCRNGLGTLPKGSVSLVVTSPPYNVGIPYNTWHDSMPHEDYLLFLEQVSKAIKRVLADSGSLFLNVGSKPTDPWKAFDVANVFRSRFVLQNHIIWLKSVAIDQKNIWGHYRPIPGTRFLNQCFEHVFHFTKKGDVELDRMALGVPHKDPNNRHRFGHDLRCRGNVWFIPYATTKESGEHPAIFPTHLVKFCLNLVGGPAKVKLMCDPFLGSGTSAIVAKSNDVDFVGFDVDQIYVEQARNAVNMLFTVFKEKKAPKRSTK